MYLVRFLLKADMIPHNTKQSTNFAPCFEPMLAI